MHHSDFLALLALIYRPDIYLELGVAEGETFVKVRPYCGRAIGVDPSPPSMEGDFRPQTTDKFFKSFNIKVDMIFIDADHSFSSAKKDLKNSYKLLNDGGIIIMHDTDPVDDKLFDPGYCGDSYKLVDLIEDNFLDLNITTLPMTEAGLSLLTKKADTRTHRR